MSKMEAIKKVLPTHPSNQTATAGMAGGALGYLIVVILELTTDLPISAEHGAGMSTACGTLSAFLWAKGKG